MRHGIIRGIGALVALAGTLALGAGPATAQGTEGEVVVYTAAQSTIVQAIGPMFEKKTGIKVVHDYFNSEQEMLTKLRTSPGTYDVVLMNNIYVMEAAHEGLIQALDTTKFSNFNNLTPALRDSDRFAMGGKHRGELGDSLRRRMGRGGKAI